MNYEDYDNDADDSDDDYFEFVEWLSSLTATELRQAKGDPQQQKQALCRYFKRGIRANLTQGELIDFLGVSSPSILDMAGYSEAEGDVLMQTHADFRWLDRRRRSTGGTSYWEHDAEPMTDHPVNCAASRECTQR